MLHHKLSHLLFIYLENEKSNIPGLKRNRLVDFVSAFLCCFCFSGNIHTSDLHDITWAGMYEGP